MKCELDNWVSNRCTSESVEVLDATTALDFVSKLDGNRHTLFTINTGENEFMIGGGPHQFVVVKQKEGDFSETLRSDSVSLSDESIYLCVGGQEGDYPPEIVVSYDLVASLVRDIFAGTDDPQKHWIAD